VCDEFQAGDRVEYRAMVHVDAVIETPAGGRSCALGARRLHPAPVAHVIPCPVGKDPTVPLDACAYDGGHGGEPCREGEPMTEKDVVCGMQVDSNQAAAESQYKGRTYHFCSEACKVKFEESPSRYAKSA
jgi:Cu+-exporting ATPase